MHIGSARKAKAAHASSVRAPQPAELASLDAALSHRDRIKLIKHEKLKKKNFDDQHRWKLQRGHAAFDRGLRARLNNDRQILLKSFLNENYKKNRFRTLSTSTAAGPPAEGGGQHSSFVVHGATGSGYENSIAYSKNQFGSTISHGVNFAKLKSASATPNILPAGAGGKSTLTQGETIKERLASGIGGSS